LIRCDKRVGKAFVASSTSTAAAVDVIFVVVGTIIINDKDQLFNVQAASGYRCGNHQFNFSALEVDDSRMAIVLVDATMK